MLASASLRTLVPVALIVGAIVAATLPAAAGSFRSRSAEHVPEEIGALAAGTGRSHEAPPPMQNPCFTQLKSDLRECVDEFCPNVFSCDHTAYEACVYGARGSFDACLEKNG